MATFVGPSTQVALPLFQALYGNAPEGTYFCLWTSPAKQTYWFPATDDGIDEALAKAGKLDDGVQAVYMSMYLTDGPKAGGQRGKVEDVVALCALIMDVDIAGPGHKSATKYPPTLKDAEDIVDAVPLPVSAVINSGNGLHGYWFLTEPFDLRTPDERADVLDLMQSWKATCQNAAASKGYAVDSVFDVTRVLRVPGTKNCKTDPPIVARILHLTPLQTYGLDDIEPILADAPDQWVKGKAEPINMVGIDLRYVSVKPEKVLLALEGDQKFRLTWERKRKDLADQSASSYCYSLAQSLVKLGLADEQIVQLLYTWRRDNDAVPKNDNWYAKTVGRARQAVGIESSTAEFLEDFKSGEVDSQEDLLKGLSQTLGFEIERLECINSDPVTYRLTYQGISRKLGGPATILNYSQFRNALGAFGLVLETKKFKAEQWDDVAKILMAAAEQRNLGQGSTEAGRAHLWLYRFLAQREPERVKPGTAYSEGRAFYHKGHAAFFGDTFLAFVQNHFKTEAQLDAVDMDQALEQIGCTQSERIDMYPGGVRTQRKAWLVPHEVYPVGQEGKGE